MKKQICIIFGAALTIIGSNLNVYAAPVSNVSVRPAAVIDKTPRENLFRMEGSGQDFVLLDYTQDGFFVSSKDYFGLHVYDPDNTGKFDTEDSNNIASWLNNEFLEEGNTYGTSTYKLPESVKRHLVERDWICEAGYVTTDYPEDYTVRAKIALMSVTEWKKYLDKLGVKDDTSSNYYFLRSVNGTSNPGTGSGIMVVSVQEGITVTGKAFNPYGVRPVFYLDKDFFVEERLDINSLGDNVAKTLREVYGQKEFSKLYSSSEIEKIFKKLPPQAVSVKMFGIPQVGKTLKASYVYKSPEEDAEGKSDYRWLRSKNISGPYAVIPGENRLEYKLRPEDAEYYVVFEVTPKSADSIGRSVRSKASIVPIEKAQLPYAENVFIDGKAVAGERLIARYEYWDDNDDIESGTMIRWQSSEDGENYSEIDGAEGLNWIVEPEFEGKYIRVVVEVRNEDDGKGIPVASEGIGPVRVLPDVKPVEIELRGDSAVIVTEFNDKGIICWEAAGEDGRYVLAQLGGKEYRLSGKESSVRVRNIPALEEGFSKKAELSNELKTSIRDVSHENDFSAQTETSGECEITVNSGQGNYAYTLSLIFKCEGVTVDEISSDSYKIFTSQTDDTLKCVLTKSEISDMIIPNELIKLRVSGKGRLILEKSEGVYKTQDGVFVKNEPRLSLNKK